MHEQRQLYHFVGGRRSQRCAVNQEGFTKANKSNPIQIVSDGEEAMDYLAGEGSYSDRRRYPLPALILLDLKLPRRSGFGDE